MKHIGSILGASIFVASGLFAPAALAQSVAIDYMITATSTQLPAGLANDVAAAGGVIVNEVPQIGVAVARSADPDFAARMETTPGVRSVVEDVTLQMLDPNEETMMLDEAEVEDMASATGERYYGLQWSLHAIGAADAWNAGLRGAGVRVAVLDSGIDADQPDIAPNLNTALSASFVPGEDWDIRPGRFFNHGTHVAATIADPANGVGVVGVAPDAEIVAVKVLSEYTGSGTSSGVIAGIVYAADIDADIINMSLGSYFTRHIYGNAAAEYAVAYSRAIAYAYQQGTTVIVSAGNSAANRDFDADGLKMPADAAHAIAIAATAPKGWYYDHSTYLDNHSSYSDYGSSAISFAAPGGDFQMYPSAGWHYDMVLSASSGGWFFSAGTSMAAPHASGVAALIIGANGGSMHPAQVEAALRASADDLGQPGKDPYYGNGRVSAKNLVP